MTALFIAVTAAGTAGALWLRAPRQARIAKMTASSAFVALAIQSGALDSGFGTTLAAGLILAWAGDLALTYRGRRAFLAGLVSFAAGHVLYVAAFSIRGLDASAATVAAVVMAVAAALIAWWLVPHVKGAMRPAVIGYLAVISVMVVTAVSTHAAGRDMRIPVGAVLFALSDLGVARDRFVTAGFGNRVVGLPLYYAAQTLIALAAGG